MNKNRRATFLSLLAFVPLLSFGAERALVPMFFIPTVSRGLYFKLPVEGAEFHWEFLDRDAFLNGELTLRIVNVRRHRDQTFVVFRAGVISDGWEMIGEQSSDGAFYFGFSTDRRVPTAPDDSLIITMVAPHNLPGRGPYTAGTLHAGTWQATGTYSKLSGNLLNPVQFLIRPLFAPTAFMQCWDVVWPLTVTSTSGWAGIAPASDRANVADDLLGNRGVDGRRCVSHRPPP